VLIPAEKPRAKFAAAMNISLIFNSLCGKANDFKSSFGSSAMKKCFLFNYLCGKAAINAVFQNPGFTHQFRAVSLMACQVRSERSEIGFDQRL